MPVEEIMTGQQPVRPDPPAVTPPPDTPGPQPMQMPSTEALLSSTPQVQADKPLPPSGIGKVFQTLMGKRTEYRPNPATGQVEETVVDRKPGDFWKSLLAGALVGGAVGAESNDFATGVSRGGAAVFQDQERQDEAGFQRAKEKFAMEQQAAQAKRDEERLKIEKQRASVDETMAYATIANLTATQIYNDKLLKLQTKDQAIRIQQLNSDIQQRLLENASKGVRPLNVPMNGQPGNGEEFMRYYVDHPEEFKVPEGKFLQMVPQYDFDGLNYDESTKTWKDTEGKTVDPADRATYTVYEVPMAAALDQVMVSGEILDKNYGVTVPDKSKNYPVRLVDLLSFAVTKLTNSAKAGSEANAERRLNWQMAYQTAQTRLEALKNRRDSIDRDDMMMGPAKQQALAPLDADIADTLEKMEDVNYMMMHDGQERPKPKSEPAAEKPAPDKQTEYSTAATELLKLFERKDDALAEVDKMEKSGEMSKEEATGVRSEINKQKPYPDKPSISHAVKGAAKGVVKAVESNPEPMVSPF